MSVILINPPFQYFSNNKATNYNRPPLGMLYVASYVEATLKIPVKIMDAYAENISASKVEERLIKGNYTIAGFSVSVSTAGTVRKIIQKIKNVRPEIFIIVGGPQITIDPTSLEDIANCSIVGEGEETFYEVIKSLETGALDRNIPGTVLNITGEIIINPPRSQNKNLDIFPFPDRTKIQNNNYKHIFNYVRKKKFTTLITSRGCAYNCYFCASKKLWGHKVRRRSIQNVIQEMYQLAKENYGLLFFDDDNLAENQTYLKNLCQEIIAQKFKFKWICHARVAKYPEELLCIMKKAGCVEVQIGVESFNQNALDAVNKKIKASEIHNCIRRFQQHNINVWATLIIGLPEDNETSFKSSVKKIIKANPFYATFILLFPFLGTQINTLYKQQNLIFQEDYAEYSWHSFPVFSTPNLSVKQLSYLQKYAYRRFYLRPTAIFKYATAAIKYGMYTDIFNNLLRFIYFYKKETRIGENGL